MRFQIATVAAACCIIGSDANEMLDGPETRDVLLPEIAHSFGATFAVHKTLDDMNLQAKDVYTLPRPPNVQDCLAALSGMPLTRQPKPYSKSTSMLELRPYQAVQTKIAEARAAALAESLAPVATSYSMSSLGRLPQLLTIEFIPGQYSSLVYIIAQALVYAIFIPAGLIGLRYAKTQAYIKKTFTLSTFFLNYASVLVLSQALFRTSSAISVLLGLAAGIFGMYFSLRSLGSLAHIKWINDKFGSVLPINLQAPVGWYACIRIFALVTANFAYQLISSLLPYRYGVAGILTTSGVYAGLLYIAYLVVCGYYIRKRVESPNGDPRSLHNVVFAVTCAYIATAGISFLVNIVAIYVGVLDLVPFDPVLFFTQTIVFDLNPTTILVTLGFVALVGAGYHEQGAMDERNKTVSNFSSLALFNFDESSKALTEALSDLSLCVVDM